MEHEPEFHEPEFAEVFEGEYARVLRLAYVITGNSETARDIAQEAFARLYASWGRVSEYAFIGAWLRRVVIRLASKQRQETALFERSSVTEDQLSTGQPATPSVELHRAVLALPKKQRIAVVLYYFEDRTAEDIANLMGCSQATIRVHLHRARHSLALVLGEEPEDVAR